MKSGSPIIIPASQAVVAAPFVFTIIVFVSLTWLLGVQISILWFLAILTLQVGAFWFERWKLLTSLGASTLASLVAILGFGVAVYFKGGSGGAANRFGLVGAIASGVFTVFIFFASLMLSVSNSREEEASEAGVDQEPGDLVLDFPQDMETDESVDAVESVTDPPEREREEEEEFNLFEDASPAEQPGEPPAATDRTEDLEFDLPLEDKARPIPEGDVDEEGGEMEPLTDDWADEALNELSRITDDKSVQEDPVFEKERHVGLTYRIIDHDSAVVLANLYGEEGYTTLDLPTLKSQLPGVPAELDLRIVKVHWVNFGEVDIYVDAAGPIPEGRWTEEDGDQERILDMPDLDTEGLTLAGPNPDKGSPDKGSPESRVQSPEEGSPESGVQGQEEGSPDKGSPESRVQSPEEGSPDKGGPESGVQSPEEILQASADPVILHSDEPAAGYGYGRQPKYVIYSQRTQRPLLDFTPDGQRPRLDRLTLYKIFKDFEFNSLKIESLRWEKEEVRIYISGSRKAKTDIIVSDRKKTGRTRPGKSKGAGADLSNHGEAMDPNGRTGPPDPPRKKGRRQEQE
ncbi:MAG: hypothetical protein JSV26_12315 [bacterium]|nr:MAG: hypothetical protein JSV26_12315 [bacterium]